MWIGFSYNIAVTLPALKWRKTVKTLGVHLGYNNKESEEKNFYDKFGGIESQMRLWNWRSLSLFGKVTVINNFIIS